MSVVHWHVVTDWLICEWLGSFTRRQPTAFLTVLDREHSCRASRSIVRLLEFSCKFSWQWLPVYFFLLESWWDFGACTPVCLSGLSLSSNDFSAPTSLLRKNLADFGLGCIALPRIRVQLLSFRKSPKDNHTFTFVVCSSGDLRCIVCTGVFRCPNSTGFLVDLAADLLWPDLPVWGSSRLVLQSWGHLDP